MKRVVATRLLHFALAAAVIHQLIGSYVMHSPRPSGRQGNFAFSLHEYVGLASVAVLFLFWIWVVIRHREHGFSDLVPWFSAAKRRALINDLRRHLAALSRFRLPLPARESALASSTHGLGLIVASIMAITGAVVYFQMGPDGSLTELGRSALWIHRPVANLMWAYLIGHASIALLHQMSGHQVFQRMFST